MPAGTPPPMSQFGYNFPQSNLSSVDSILLSASKRLKTATPLLSDQNKSQFLNHSIRNEVSSSSEVNIQLKETFLN